MIKVDTKSKWLALHRKYEEKYEKAYFNNDADKVRYYGGKLIDLGWSWELYRMQNEEG